MEDFVHDTLINKDSFLIIHGIYILCVVHLLRRYECKEWIIFASILSASVCGAAIGIITST